MELTDLVNSVIIFLSQTTLLRWITFQIPNCDFHSPTLLDLFISFDASICSTDSLHWEILIMLLPQFPLVFHQFHNGMPISWWSVWLFSYCWGYLHDHLTDIPWEDIFKLGATVVASEFCEWVPVGVNVYIPHHNFQIKPHWSPWFSAVCAAAIVHRNHFFCLYQQNKFSKSKAKLSQASNHSKRVLEAVKFVYVDKTRKSIMLPRNLALETFSKLPIVFSKKVDLLYLLYPMALRCFLLHLIKQNCWKVL